MKKILFLVCLLFSNSAIAEDKTPAEKMMVTMGIDKILYAQKDAHKADAKKQVAIVMKQLEGVLSQIPKETNEEIKIAMSSLMSSLLNSWDVETAIKVYADEWNKNYTPKEIKEVIDKYEDPSAKKEIEVVMAAATALNQYISNSYNVALEQSMAELMRKIQQAIIEGKRKMESNKATAADAKSRAAE